MPPDDLPVPPAWSEENSQTFIDMALYYVPDREEQIHTICALIPPCDRPFSVLELCCGEGLLAAAILERFPLSQVTGLDGSPRMLAQAHQNLAGFGARFSAGQFNLAASDWRRLAAPVQAVVSSLAIHHLDDREKAALYQDIYAMLSPGGVLVIADLIQPASDLGNDLAAEAYDETVRRQSLALDGNTAFFDHFQRGGWNLYRYPDEMDKPSGLFDQLKWLEQAGFRAVDVYWIKAGHAIYGGQK
ncbi:MAG: class I SAM-dependent methyltransferase [Chloroflexota bacterium]